MHCMNVVEAALIGYARHFPVRAGKLRVVNALWRAGVRNDDFLRIATLDHGGFRMSCDLNEMLQRQYYFFGTYFVEQHMLRLWADMAHGAHVIFDVGANNGIFSLAA